MFEQLVGKTIQKSEYKEIRYYSEYEFHYTNAEWVYFTDGTGIVVYSIIEESGSRHIQASSEICIDWMDTVCQRCGTVRPDPYEDCWLSKEIIDAGTEPHIFLTKEKVEL